MEVRQFSASGTKEQTVSTMEVKILNGKIIVKLGTKRDLLDVTSANWDELSGDGRVKQILITYSQDAINSIQIAYEQNEKLKLTPRHGGDGDNLYAMGLRFNEHFTSVRGYFGVTKSTNYTVIRSLRFDTNLGSFGPFGSEEGTPFSFNLHNFCGFHGCSNSKYLTAIEVHLDISNLIRFQYPTEPNDARRPSLYQTR
ncbi:jacalin-related lectin 3-like [Zingiber officinale]|uniref:jacalin-related lectin 3-like n=1 Tax=Zingiber officinale TaxID=94328 RepID=UPI001C4B4448|nr:jacalin-related lectin 3-like [Zingiber officinale]